MTQPELFTRHQDYGDYGAYALAVHNYYLSRSQKFGLMAEKFICTELIERGHTANLVSDFNAPFDILVNDFLPVEVKAAKVTYRKVRHNYYRRRYQFKLTSKLQRQDYLFCLVAVDDNGELFTFVIPSAFIGDRQTISLTSHPNSYKGQWSKYLNAWNWIDQVTSWRIKYQQSLYGQLSIFDDLRVQ